MDHAKKPAKQGFAAFGFTKIDAKAHQQVIERQVAPLLGIFASQTSIATPSPISHRHCQRLVPPKLRAGA